MSESTTAWEVTNLARDAETGRVIFVHWTVTKCEAGLTASAYGTTELTASADPTSPAFKPFHTLTEADVVRWVHESMGAEYLAEVLADLDLRITEQKAPPVVLGLPW